MDVSKFNCIFSLSILTSLLSVGCAESNGYTDYSDLPQPATGTTTAQVESNTTKPVDTESATDPNTESPVMEKPEVTVTSAGDTDVENVKPVEAVYGEGDQGGNESNDNRELKLLVPEKTFPAIKGSDAIRVSYDDIDLEKILNVITVPDNVVDHFPDWLKQLNGKKVRMRGFMYPSFVEKGLKSFVFTRDTGACCFGPNPYIFLRAKVRLSEGEKTDYIHMQPFDVEGTFRISPKPDEDGLWRLYSIENARVL